MIDKVVEDNDNIREVLVLSKEPLGNTVKEIVNIIEGEGETKVDVEEYLKNTSSSCRLLPSKSRKMAKRTGEKVEMV